MKITLGENYIDLENFTIVLKNNEIIELTRSEKRFLECVFDSESVASYDNLIEFIWGLNDEDKTYKSVQDIWSALKQKAPFLSKYAKNIRGQGYQRENNKKIDSPFTESLYTILTATYPDKRGTNTTDKKITVTRYTLFALIKQAFPNETKVLSLLSDDSKTPEELTEEFSSVEVLSTELASMQTRIVFEWQVNYKGKKTGLIVIQPKKTTVETINNDQCKKELDTLMESYLALPVEFHNNVKSLLKREINTTISELVLSVAYKGAFSKSEHARSELLTICDSLVRTHNHHNSYLYALIEKTRNEEYLFKQYNSNDYECIRAIEVIKSFFKDNWLTEQSASYIGSNFLRWCKDKNVVLDLINNHCFDQRIWLEFASKYNGANTIRRKIQSEIFEKTNFKDEHNFNNLISFLQMVTKGDFKFLAFNGNDEKYNNDVRKFIIFILQNLLIFPEDKQIMIAHGIAVILSNCNGYDPNNEHSNTKEILSQLNIDWSLDCYKPIKILQNKILGNIFTFTSPADITKDLVEFSCQSENVKNKSENLEDISKKLRILLLDKSHIFDERTKKATIEVIKLLLENNLDENYLTILATEARFYLFPSEVCEKIYYFTLDFLKNCDYSQQSDTVIKRALSILKHSNYINSQSALENCFINISKIKKCRPFELTSFLLEGLTIELIISKIRLEKDALEKPYSQTINWLLVDKNNRKVFSQNLHINILFEFVDKLIDNCNDNLLWEDLNLSVIHFAKKQDCFADKVPSSDQFYAELLLDANNVNFDIEYLKEKAKEHKLSFNTALFHLCKVLKDNPHDTAYICIEYLAKLFGQLEYSYYNPENHDLYETHLFQKRKEIFSLLISNPSIRNTAKLYCSRMRRFAKSLSPAMIELITKVVQEDEFPLWLSDIYTNKPDEIKESIVRLSELNYLQNDRPAGVALNKEISEQLMPWLENATMDSFYEPSSFILAIKKDNSYNVVDGNRAINHFVSESIAYGDFRIKVWVVEL